jgi:hypothetical protein
LATIVCVALTVESGVPVPLLLANVETVNGTFVPEGVVSEIWHERLPLALVVQPGDVAVSGTTVTVPPFGVNVSEFVDGETYCARRTDELAVGGAGIVTLSVAFAVLDDETGDVADGVLAEFALDAGMRCEPPPPEQADNTNPISAGTTMWPVFMVRKCPRCSFRRDGGGDASSRYSNA